MTGIFWVRRRQQGGEWVEGRILNRAELHFGPIGAPQRIQVLDILRGFALLGILLVNMAYFNTPIYLAASDARWFPGLLDRGAAWLMVLLAENKFVTIFSFLFGFGMALQMERAVSRDAPFVMLSVRRSAVLLIMGLIHGLLIWMGDILTAYGILGLALLLFRKRSQRTLKIWSVILIVMPVLFSGLLVGVAALSQNLPSLPTATDAQAASSASLYDRLAAEALQAYATGTWAQIQETRTAEFWFIYSGMGLGGTLLYLMGIFLVGFQAGRAHLLRKVDAHLPFVRQLLGWSLGIGLSVNALYAIISSLIDRGAVEPGTILYMAAFIIGAPALSTAYVTGILLLCRNPGWETRLAHLAPVGRMALSNYLLQSLICTTLFYSYGGGLYGRVGPFSNVLLALVIFSLQIPLSRWWLSRFRFGPAEWLWRSLTYGVWQPLRQ